MSADNMQVGHLKVGSISEEGWKLMDEIHNQSFLNRRKPPIVMVSLTGDLWKQAKRLVTNEEDLKNLLLEGLNLVLAKKGR